jgi:hypothetical protein
MKSTRLDGSYRVAEDLCISRDVKASSATLAGPGRRRSEYCSYCVHETWGDGDQCSNSSLWSP